MLWRIFTYTWHLFHIRHRKGHGIHSPYLFEFVNGVLFNGNGVTPPRDVMEEHRKLKKDGTMISTASMGMDSTVVREEKRSLGSFVKKSSVSEKYATLLYRIVRWFDPDMIVELGGGLGVSTLYLAAGAPGTALHSIEGNTERAAFAAQLICRSSSGQVSIHWGEMEEKLEEILPLLTGRFVAFVDGNHRYEPTLAYVEKLLEKAGEEALIVMDDIYWTKGMQRAWQEIILRPQVRVSIDLYHMGILLLRKELPKSHLKINF